MSIQPAILTRRLCKRLPWFWLMSVALLLLLLWSGVEVALKEQRNTVSQLIAQRATARAASYHLQIEDLTNRFDQVANMLIKQWQRSPETLDFAETMSGLLPDYYPVYVFITDANGKLSRSTFKPKFDRVAGLDFFESSRRDCSPRLQVTQVGFLPVVGEKVVRFSKCLTHPDGTFSGLLVFAAAPDFLESFQDETSLQPGDFITVRALDGPVIATRLAAGQPLQIFYREHPRFPSPAGVRREPGELFVDGKARYVAWRRHSSLPLVALAAVAEAPVLAEFEVTATNYRRLAAFATVAFLVLATTGAVATVRRREKEAAEREVRAIYRASTDAADEGFFMLRPIFGPTGNLIDVCVEDCNERAGQLLGLDRLSLLGKSAATVLQREVFADLLEFTHRALEHRSIEEERRVPAREKIPARWMYRRAVAVGSGVALSLRDITKTKEHEEHLRGLAHRDALTGLPNRQWLMEFLPAAIERAERAHLKLALMFIDLDNFKAVNDTLGHEAGDQLLRDVAGYLRSSVRSSDHVVRLAGDEFVVIIEFLKDSTTAEAVAQKIIDTLHLALQGVNGPQARVNASIGISLFPQDGSNPEALLRTADIAMYASKSAGRARYSVYHPEAQPEA